MASVKAFIRVAAGKKSEKDVAVRFRVSDGRDKQLFYKSDIMVDPDVWDPKKERIKAKVVYSRVERVLFDESIRNMKSLLEKVYEEASDKNALTSDEFDKLVKMKLHPEDFQPEKEQKNCDFFYQYEYFLQVKNYPRSDNKNYLTMERMLKRFELYKTLDNGKEWKLSFDTINVEVVRELEDFIRNEYKLVKHRLFKVIYKELPESCQELHEKTGDKGCLPPVFLTDFLFLTIRTKSNHNRTESIQNGDLTTFKKCAKCVSFNSRTCMNQLLCLFLQSEYKNML